MGLKDEPLEAGCEDVPITLKSRLDIYVGKVVETTDSEGNRVLCAVTEINNVQISKGKLTLECKMLPLQLMTRG